MRLLILFFFLILSLDSFGQASPAVIFNAGYGKVIPQFGLRFNDLKTAISGNLDPSAIAVDAPRGSLYISSNGGLYQKQDNGSSINWTRFYIFPSFANDNRLVKTDGLNDVQQTGITVDDSNSVTGALNLSYGGSFFTPLAVGRVTVIDPTSALTVSTVTTAELEGFSGDIAGKLNKFPSEINDNRIARTDVNGNALQGSTVAISDTGAMTGISELNVDNLLLDGNTVSVSDVNGNLNLNANGTGSVLLGGSGNLSTSALNTNLTLDANGTGIVDVNAPINIESVIANRVVYGNDTTGNLEGSANFLYASSTDLFRVAGLDFTNNTIESVALNTDITLSPDGTGEVNLTKPTNIEDLRIENAQISSTILNSNITLAPNGTGVVSVTKDLSVTQDANITQDLNVLGASYLDDVTVLANQISTSLVNGDLLLSGNGTGNVKVLRDGVAFKAGSNNPELGELMKYPSFEESDTEVTVTNATKLLVANNRNGTQALQCTGTGASARCCVQVAVPAQRQLQRHEVSCSLKTTDTGVRFTLRNNSLDRGFYEVASTNEWTAYSFLVDANTNVGFCIDQANTDVTLIDDCSITSDLSKSASIDCPNELDCENEFSAYYNSEVVVGSSLENLSIDGWVTGVTKSEASDRIKSITVPSGIFNNIPNCTSAAGANGASADYIRLASTTTTLVFSTTVASTGSAGDFSFSFDCMKTGSDYKKIPERGVINVNMDAQNDTDWVAYTPTFQGFGTPTGIEFYWRKNGASIDVIGKFLSGVSTAVEGRVGLPSSLVIDGNVPSGNFSTGRAIRFAGASAYEKNLSVLATTAQNYVGFGVLGDSGTGDPSIKLNGSSLFADTNAVTLFFSIPIEGWTARQEIVADIIEKVIYDGNEYLTDKVSVIGGVGFPTYRRCYNIASDITTTSTIATVDANLNPIEAINTDSTIWIIKSFTDNGTNLGASWIRYNRSTGVIDVVLGGSLKVGAGTRFCFEYTK